MANKPGQYIMIPRNVFLRWFVRAFVVFSICVLLQMLAPKFPPDDFVFYILSDVSVELLITITLLCAIICIFNLLLLKFPKRNLLQKGVLLVFITVATFQCLQTYFAFDNILSLDTAHFNHRLYHLAYPDPNGGRLLYECSPLGIFCHLVDRGFSAMRLDVKDNQLHGLANEFSLVYTYQPSTLQDKESNDAE